MCLIIHKPVGQTIPAWIVESAHEYNSDGVGIMHNGHFDKWANIKTSSVNKKLAKLKETELAIHFRFATHGSVDRDNAHPYPLSDGGLLMHNGILSKYAKSSTKGKSDTANFVTSFVNPRLKKMRKNEPMKKALADIESEGWGNRFAIMDSANNIHRLGQWSQYEGLNFSNLSMWDYPHYKTYGNTPKYMTRGYNQSDYDYDHYPARGRQTTYVQDDYEMENSRIGEVLRETCGVYADHLDIEMYGDTDELFAELQMDEISTTEYLTYCASSTIVALYSDLVRRDVLPRGYTV
jgi:predicted glutamine amidotransferase